MTNPDTPHDAERLASAIDRAERLIGNIQTFGAQQVARGSIPMLEELIAAALRSLATDQTK